MTALCRDIMNNIYKMYVSTGLLVMFSVLFSCLSSGFMGWVWGGGVFYLPMFKANAFLYIQKSLECSKILFRSACVLSKCNTSYGS